ncbi:DsbA family protein [Leptospira fluminis]|uniref:DsbA family protein n=1 Tax=Leptospira fluminis TaxID=2484979 RepID=A0A4R9GLL5_9LEPT|nr:DsbA family protein [Leptospira fluminis]TGK15646.1 DsbA family protein [Leptospira fluminis]
MEAELFQTQGKHSLLYVADPLCTWSYAFGPSIAALREKYSDKIEFSLVLGGYRFGSNVEPFTQESTDRLRYVWKEAERISKRKFDYEILKRRDLVLDSEPSCRAVIAAQRLAPGTAFEFMDSLSYGFHALGKDPTDPEVFIGIARDFGMKESEFRELYSAKETVLETETDFNYGFQLGVTGFPTLVFSDGIERGILTKGYLSFEEVDSILADYFRSIGRF